MKLNLFDAFGVELEYMIVDQTTLQIKPIADELLKAELGTYGSDFTNGTVSWSNELALHVIELNPTEDVWLYSKLAEAEGNIGNYEDALEHVKIFLENPDIKGDARIKGNRMRTNYTFAKEAVKNPVEFNPENMGENVNSDFPEYFPSLSVDGGPMVMTRRIDDVISVGAGDMRKIDNEDFFISYFENGEWTLAQNMGAPINTKKNPCVSIPFTSLLRSLKKPYSLIFPLSNT